MELAPDPQQGPARVLIADDEPLFVETVQALGLYWVLLNEPPRAAAGGDA